MEEKAFEYIDAIAANLGVAAEHVYGALLKQAMISGISSLVYIPIYIAIIVAYVFMIRKIYSDVSENKESMLVDNSYAYRGELSGISFTIMSIGGVLSLILFISVIFDINNAVTALLNPEYWALKEILDTIKGAEY